MNKIIIAIDYHPTSELVAKAGYELANKLGARVGLIHVLADVRYYGLNHPTILGYEGYDENMLDLNIESELRQMAEDFLETAAKNLQDPTISTRLAEGDAATAIMEYADECDASMIIMGTHSHSFLEKLLMGTTASRIIERTKIPVYLVPVKKD
ncbi:universal stress protein [Salegentibacter sp. HM20]